MTACVSLLERFHSLRRMVSERTQIFEYLHKFIGGLQPVPRDPNDNGVAAMLDDRTFCFVIQNGRHTVVFLDLQGLVANHQFYM